MKKCTMGMFSKIVVFPLLAAGAIPFGGLVVFAVAAYRVLYRGIGWVEYDKDAVIFHCSRREQYRFLGKIFLKTVFRLALGRADV